jgi:CheY-like chemotaxis protein
MPDFQNTLRVLVVEDNPFRTEVLQEFFPSDIRTTFARTAGNAIGILRRDPGSAWKGILLDHDLDEQAGAGDGLCGRDVVTAILDHVSTDVPILIHSINPAGAAEMNRILERAGFCVTRIPMDQLTKDKLLEWVDEVREIWEDDLETD